MRNPGQFIIVMLAAAAVAGVTGCAAGGGTASASKPPGAASTVPAGSSGGKAAGPARDGAARFLDYQDNDGPVSSAVLTGAIGDYGKAVSVNANGTLNSQHDSELQFRLSRGTFRLDVASLDRLLVGAFTHFPADTGSCSGVVTVAHEAPVVTGSGTGAYRGMTGAFTVTITIAEVDAKTGCSPSSPFLAQQVVTSGTGDVSFSPS